MKINIFYELNKYSTEITKPIKIKDIISNFINSKKLIEQNFLIFDESQKIISENKIVKVINNEELTLYLIPKNEDYKEEKDIPIEDLILKVTGTDVELEYVDLNQPIISSRLIKKINRKNYEEINIYPDDDLLEQLNGMGFNIERARIALERNNNNIIAAIDFLTEEN